MLQGLLRDTGVALCAPGLLRLSERNGQKSRRIIAAGRFQTLMNAIKHWFVLKRGHLARSVVASASAEL